MTRHKSISLILLFITMLGSQLSVSTGSTESDANSVEIKLYPASLSDWSSGIESSFASTVATQTTTYCGTSPSACGLDNGNTFSSADVTVHSKSESSRSLMLSVYVSFPAGSNVTSGGSTTVQLPLAALKVILKASRDSVKSNIDMYITYIGSDYYGIPPESTANGIIIPIAAVTVVAVGISAVVMVYFQETREKKERAAARLARKRALKTLPNYNIQEVPHTSEVPEGIPGEPSGGTEPTENHNQSHDSQALNNNHALKKRFELPTRTTGTSSPVNYFHSNGNVGNSATLPPLSSGSVMTNTTTTTTTGSTAATTTTILPTNIHGSHYQQEQGQLQQNASFDESEEDKKKRRKKEKKREKKRLLQQQQQQQLRELEQGGLELHDQRDFDTSAMTVSETGATPRDMDNIPTFTVQRKEELA